EACGRILAENIISRYDIPPRNISAVDGYAVRSQDTSSASAKQPLKLKIMGELFPTSAQCGSSLLTGQAMYVACGAPIPDGSDAVIRVEDTIRKGDEIEIRRPIENYKNVILAGEDVKQGSIVLSKGHILRPQDIGLLAALRITKVNVFKKPRVAIISVGDELTSLKGGEPSKTINNYAFIISAAASEFGALPEIVGIAPDNISEIAKKIKKALTIAEIIITIGGCSVGVKDFVPDAVSTIGKPGVITHGVKISPGKVTGLGVIEGKPIVMLPGHIASCIAGFYLFVVPLIRLYSGLPAFCAPKISAKISQDVKAKYGLKLFLRVRVSKIDGEFIAEPIYGGSSSLNTLIRSSGFTILDEGTFVKMGDKVTVTLFSDKELLKL
ncbi:molybdopterin molybdotransferase MoeA, partial [Candidatus Bathyarchaeota archaeon]|nr:molybdopterin molybdotransferase MoeA [Candidatus Bathyarchaeota archaeon]